MSRKPRQTRASKSPQGSKAGEQPKREAATAKPEAAGTETLEEPAKAETTTAKIAKLPAFGFAEDLLGKKEPDDAGGSAGPRPAGFLGSDPERIFSFADSLEAEDRDEPAADPTCITTWVTFDLGQEIFALPVEPVREVLRVASITRVPHAPRPIRGVTNLRGRVIPVIDLRIRIGLEPKGLDRASRVIVVGARNHLLGLLVDAVHQVLHIDLNQAQSPPDDVMTVQSDYITGVYHHGERLILLLDVDRAMVVQDSATAGGVRKAGDGEGQSEVIS